MSGDRSDSLIITNSHHSSTRFPLFKFLITENYTHNERFDRFRCYRYVSSITDSHLAVIASALECAADQNYVRILKVNKNSAAEESFKVLAGSATLIQSITLTDNEAQTFEYCIAKRSNSQYTLEMKDSYGDSWTTGSYIEIRGKYDNLFFKNYMIDKTREQYALSLYYPIEKNDQWKMTTGATGTIGTWTQYAFDDNSWTAVTLGSASAVSGTQYFRKTFTGVTGMAAYETRLNYRYGVVAYVNGAEVFRDNMPAGEVTASTLAPGGYENYAYHAFIRPGSEVASTQSVLAVELHFTDLNSHAVDFDAFMALLTPTVQHAPCYSVMDQLTLTSTMSLSSVNNMNKGVSSSSPLGENGINVQFSVPNTHMYVNGLRMWPSTSPTYLPKTFTWGGKNSGISYNTVMNIVGMSHSPSVDSFAYGYFNANLYKEYQLHVTATGSTSLRLYEIYPLVCTVGVPQNILFEPAAYTYNALYDEVSIRPVVTEFTGCTISPAAPAGLTFDAATCTLSGKATAQQAATTYTVTSVVGGQTYTGTFSLTLTTCSNVMLNIRRVYKSAAAREGFFVRFAWGNVVYREAFATVQQASTTQNHYVCVPKGGYSVYMEGTTNYWSNGSFLYIDVMLSPTEKETVLRARFDSTLGVDSVRSFSLEYPVDYKTQWKYKMGEVPAGWQTGDVSAWSEAAMGSFPESSNTIQLYRNSFTVANPQTHSGIVLSLRYKFGCIVYLNGNEAFRNGVVGELSTSSVTENTYTEVKYRSISLPIRTIVEGSTPAVNYIQQGANTIAIAIVSTSSVKTSFFDCALRFMAMDKESRLLEDYTASSSGISGMLANVFLEYCSASVSSNNPSNYIDIKFGNDRREWIGAVTVQLHYQQTSQYPGQFTLEARNKASEQWTTLKTVTGMTWSQKGQAKKLHFVNNKPYNQYRFENFAGPTPAATWKISRLDLQSVATTTTIPGLQYNQGQPLEIYKDIEMGEAYPNEDLFYDYAVTPALPEGITLDPNTGMISGTTHTSASTTTHTITATKLNGEQASCTLTFSVAICTGDRSLITLVARADSNPAQSSYKLYEGKGLSGEVKASVPAFSVANSLNYGDFCMAHGIYTLQLLDTAKNGWTNPAGYYLTVDVGEMKFEMGQVPSGVPYVTTLFSSFLPFQIDYDDWVVLTGANAPANWNSVDFVPSDWATVKAAAIGTNAAITTYIRREFSIPDLEDYAVLNVRVKYTGGVVAYVNGHKVARFNLEETFDANTQSIEAKAEPVFSVFHVILNTVQAATDKNVMAFEVHRPKDTSSEVPVVFDATGVFGVNDCSPALDSFAVINGTEPSSGTLEGFFDLSPISYGYLPNAVGTFMEWSVENLEGTRFNAYAWQTVYARTSWGFSLYTRKSEEEDYTSALALLEQSTKALDRNTWSVPVGIAGFRQLRFEVDDTASSTVSFSAHFLLYCRPASAGACPAIDEYPMVGEGQISPAECPYGFRGYAYRECHNNVLGDVKTDKCTYKVPSDMQYEAERFTFVMDVPTTTGKPTFTNLITHFFMDEVTPLPEGLTLDEETGEISGSAKAVSEATYTVHGENPKGATFVAITISVRKGYCPPEGLFQRTDVGEVAVYECSQQGSYVGTQKRACVLGEKDGEWQQATGFCMPVMAIVLLVVVVIVIIAVVVFLIVRTTRKSKAVGGVKKGKKDASKTKEGSKAVKV